MYHRGTLAQFNTWHIAAKTAYGIPEDGIIGFVDGKPAPENQRTTSYSIAIQNPAGGDDYIWNYGSYPDSNLQTVSQGWVVDF